MMISQKKSRNGFTLVELIVSVGLFAVVMTLAAGAYLLMISISQQTQGTTTAVNNLSFALESMVRGIRTGTGYSCSASQLSVDCTAGGSSFSYRDASGATITYQLAGPNGKQYIAKNASLFPITDPSLINITSLGFFVVGTSPASGGNYDQPYVTIVVSGTVSIGKGKTQSFTMQTGAVMRGTDL
ncbi:MAG: seg [Parcubacteria group bacterium]|nr:seg [Parcubacteria group bacterium]